MRGAPVAYGQPPTYRSALLWGALIGALALVAVVLAVLFGVGSTGYRPDGVPSEILVICPVQDSEGATVAGILFMIDPLGAFTMVDSGLEATIPGTSYETLGDAFPFGGGAAVAAAYSEVLETPIPAWLVLPQGEWEAIVDASGGAQIDVDIAVNAYVDGELLSIDEGTQVLGGAELSALWASAAYAPTPGARERVTQGVVSAVAGAVSGSWDSTVRAALEGEGSSPVLPDDLRAFGVGLSRQ